VHGDVLGLICVEGGGLGFGLAQEAKLFGSGGVGIGRCHGDLA
jgi:hypothetical protein